MFYSFSFLPDLEQEWPLTERYPGQPEILRYLEEVAERLDLRKDFTFGAEVNAIEFDEAAGRWTLRTAQGHRVTARYVVTAVGCLSTANQPEFPGADTFGGLSLHTGNWPREPVDLAGKRVAVIGTGASGIQAIPLIAEQAAHLTVFQRTAQFTIPAENEPLDEQFVALVEAELPGVAPPRAALRGRVRLQPERHLRVRGVRGRAPGDLRGRVGRGRLHVPLRDLP